MKSAQPEGCWSGFPKTNGTGTPHERSMKLGRLACHVAELTQFATAVAETDNMDFAKGEYKVIDAPGRPQLLEAFDKAAARLAPRSPRRKMKSW